MRTTYDRLDQVVTPRPNWAGTVKETFEYKTELFMSEDGHEDRHSYRTNPRWTVQYRADMLDEAANQLFYDLVRPWQDREFVAPVRWRGMTMRETTASGSSSMDFDGTAPWWLQDSVTLVLESKTTQDSVIVDSVTQNVGEFTVAFTSTTGAEFVAGDRAMLGFVSHYEADNTLKAAIQSHRTFSPTFLADPARLPTLQPPTTGYETYKGYEVVLPRHNWTDDLSVELDDRQETFDPGRGIIDRVWARTHRNLTETRQHTAMSEAQAAELVQRFMRHRGMRDPFWTPALSAPIPANDTATAGYSNLFFPGFEFREVFEDDPILNHIWVQWPDGAVQVNKIANYSTSTGTDFAQMEDDWERDIDSDTVVKWALLARFGTDRLELNWQTGTVLNAQLPIKALRSDWVADNTETDNLLWP